MTTFKIAIAVVVLIAINNWSILNNIFNFFNGGIPNFLSIEKFITDVLNISRVVSTSFTLSIGLGAIFVKLAFVIIITFVLYLSFRSALSKDKIKENTKSFAGVTLVEFTTSDIYLKNDKLIC